MKSEPTALAVGSDIALKTASTPEDSLNDCCIAFWGYWFDSRSMSCSEMGGKISTVATILKSIWLSQALVRWLFQIPERSEQAFAAVRG